MDSDEQSRKRQELAGELGRKAGKFVKNAGPRTKKLIEENRPKVEKAIQDARPKVEKAVEQYRPRVEQAGRDAVRYAQEHEDEIKGMALKGARMRLGPLGMAIDALGIGAEPAKAQETCPACQAANVPSATFCSECGGRLNETPDKIE
jgi:hypothetical protein